MALGGIFNGKDDVIDNGNESEKNAPPFQDPENLTGGHKWGRIDKPISSIVGKRASVAEGAELDEDGNDLSVGKQVQMEEENAIKYRSCGWKKVCIGPFFALLISHRLQLAYSRRRTGVRCLISAVADC